MVMVSIKELHDDTSAVIRRLRERGPIIVTRHGKPVAVIQPITEEELEDFVLVHHPDFHEGLREALEDYAAGRIKPLSEVKPDLGLSNR
ncbi:MAG TPA: type II toxin-antitoxin system prevent-host-death family antitoxin [Candidatus Acetothermia bacterium]|nr:type II toxin-antitoxin system prevent-host-death family antitoxin [Candidatus Acetothermia bacterium]